MNIYKEQLEKHFSCALDQIKEIDIVKKITVDNEPTLVKDLRGNILKAIGLDSYKSWILTSKFDLNIKTDDVVLDFIVPWRKSHFLIRYSSSIVEAREKYRKGLKKERSRRDSNTEVIF